jgi:hypothetical protein
MDSVTVGPVTIELEVAITHFGNRNLMAVNKERDALTRNDLADAREWTGHVWRPGECDLIIIARHDCPQQGIVALERL